MSKIRKIIPFMLLPPSVFLCLFSAISCGKNSDDTPTAPQKMTLNYSTRDYIFDFDKTTYTSSPVLVDDMGMTVTEVRYTLFYSNDFFQINSDTGVVSGTPTTDVFDRCKVVANGLGKWTNLQAIAYIDLETPYEHISFQSNFSFNDINYSEHTFHLPSVTGEQQTNNEETINSIFLNWDQLKRDNTRDILLVWDNVDIDYHTGISLTIELSHSTEWILNIDWKFETGTDTLELVDGTFINSITNLCMQDSVILPGSSYYYFQR